MLYVLIFVSGLALAFFLQAIFGQLREDYTKRLVNDQIRADRKARGLDPEIPKIPDLPKGIHGCFDPLEFSELHREVRGLNDRIHEYEEVLKDPAKLLGVRNAESIDLLRKAETLAAGGKVSFSSDLEKRAVWALIQVLKRTGHIK